MIGFSEGLVSPPCATNDCEFLGYIPQESRLEMDMEAQCAMMIAALDLDEGVCPNAELCTNVEISKARQSGEL